MTVINIVELHWQSEGLGLDDRCSSHVLISLDASNIHLHRHQARRYLRELRIRFLCCAHWREYYIFLLLFLLRIYEIDRSTKKNAINEPIEHLRCLLLSLFLILPLALLICMHFSFDRFYIFGIGERKYFVAIETKNDASDKICVRGSPPQLCALSMFPRIHGKIINAMWDGRTGEKLEFKLIFSDIFFLYSLIASPFVPMIIDSIPCSQIHSVFSCMPMSWSVIETMAQTHTQT